MPPRQQQKHDSSQPSSTGSSNTSSSDPAPKKTLYDPSQPISTAAKYENTDKSNVFRPTVWVRAVYDQGVPEPGSEKRYGYRRSNQRRRNRYKNRGHQQQQQQPRQRELQGENGRQDRRRDRQQGQPRVNTDRKPLGHGISVELIPESVSPRDNTQSSPRNETQDLEEFDYNAEQDPTKKLKLMYKTITSLEGKLDDTRTKLKALVRAYSDLNGNDVSRGTTVVDGGRASKELAQWFQKYDKELSKDVHYSISLSQVLVEFFVLSLTVSVSLLTKYDIESKIWKTALYGCLDHFRSYFRLVTKSSSSTIPKSQIKAVLEKFRQVLDNGEVVLFDILFEILSQWRAHQSQISQQKDSVSKTAYARGNLETWWWKFLGYLGDLERYHSFYYPSPYHRSGTLRKRDWAGSRRYYKCASLLNPSHGLFLSNIGLLNTYADSPLYALTFYLKSLVVKHSYHSAKESLTQLFISNAKALKREQEDEKDSLDWDDTATSEEEEESYSDDSLDDDDEDESSNDDSNNKKDKPVSDTQRKRHLLERMFVLLVEKISTNIGLDTFSKDLHIFKHRLTTQMSRLMRFKEKNTRFWLSLIQSVLCILPPTSSSSNIQYRQKILSTVLEVLAKYYDRLFSQTPRRRGYESKILRQSAGVVGIHAALCWMISSLVSKSSEADLMADYHRSLSELVLKQNDDLWIRLCDVLNAFGKILSHENDNEQGSYENELEELKSKLLPEDWEMRGLFPWKETHSRQGALTIVDVEALIAKSQEMVAAIIEDDEDEDDDEHIGSAYHQGLSEFDGELILSTTWEPKPSSTRVTPTRSRREMDHFKLRLRRILALARLLCQHTERMVYYQDDDTFEVIIVHESDSPRTREFEKVGSLKDEQSDNDDDDSFIEEIQFGRKLQLRHKSASSAPSSTPTTPEPLNYFLGNETPTASTTDLENLKQRQEQLNTLLAKHDSQPNMTGSSSKSRKVPLTPYKTVFVFDTNCWLEKSGTENIETIILAPEWGISVPLVVVSELEGLRQNYDDPARAHMSQLATKALSMISFYLNQPTHYPTPTFPKSAQLRLQTSQGNFVYTMKLRLQEANDSVLNDDIILKCVQSLGEFGVLVTEDKNLMLKTFARNVNVLTMKELRAKIKSQKF